MHPGAPAGRRPGLAEWIFDHDDPMQGLPAAPSVGYYYVRVRQEGYRVARLRPVWVLLPQ
jgi:hypothetical protein